MLRDSSVRELSAVVAAYSLSLQGSMQLGHVRKLKVTPGRFLRGRKGKAIVRVY